MTAAEARAWLLIVHATVTLYMTGDLFKDGKFLDTTEAHRPLGELWESMGGSWGGRFNDGNHYELKEK